VTSKCISVGAFDSVGAFGTFEEKGLSIRELIDKSQVQ
jgi:hypothetical protein